MVQPQKARNYKGKRKKKEVGKLYNAGVKIETRGGITYKIMAHHRGH